MDDDIQKKLDELVKNSDMVIASPDVIKNMQKKGLPIKSTFTTYQEYLDKLFAERRKRADELVDKLPHLSADVANGTITALYEELKECFVLGIPGASITLAILLLDIAAKFKLFDERKKTNPSASWKPIEDLHLKEVIHELKACSAITEEEEIELLKFNREIRNNYLHYNIQKLIKDMVIIELPALNVETGKITIEKNVKPEDRPYLWFSAKRVLDRKTVIIHVNFSIRWVNRFLTKTK